MSEYTEAESIPPQRPKEVVYQDLDNIQKEFDALEDIVKPWNEKIDALPEDKQTIIEGLNSRLQDGDITDEEVERDIPEELRPLVNEYRQLSAKLRDIQSRERGLQREALPYKKEELKKVADELASKVNFDAIFDYYREIDLGQRERVENTDLLANMATELYILRQYQYDTRKESEDDEFWHYDSGLRLLRHYEETWAKKGFILDAPRDTTDAMPVFGEQVRIERQKLAIEVGEASEQLEEYGHLCRTYRPAIFNREHRDHALDSIHRVLDTDAKDALYYSDNFDEVDFDPEFVSAAKRHVDKVLDEHRRAGRISRTPEVLAEERRRIDAIPESELFADIQIEGFTPTEGMIAVVKPEEILAEIKVKMPPDFARMLKRLEYKPSGPDEKDADDPTIETVGRFIPEFSEGSRWDVIDHTRIENYQPLFVAKGTNDIEARVARSFFMGTIWHELGHNAHYTLDYDEMKAWEKVMEDDKTAITWYVKHSRGEEETRGKREDFAETFKLYIKSPALLATISPLRYLYMTDYFTRHLQTRQKDGFRQAMILEILLQQAVWKAQDMSTEDVKNMYLSHELEED